MRLLEITVKKVSVFLNQDGRMFLIQFFKPLGNGFISVSPNTMKPEDLDAQINVTFNPKIYEILLLLCQVQCLLCSFFKQY